MYSFTFFSYHQTSIDINFPVFFSMFFYFFFSFWAKLQCQTLAFSFFNFFFHEIILCIDLEPLCVAFLASLWYCLFFVCFLFFIVPIKFSYILWCLIITYGERFHQDTKVIEERYQGRWDKRIMADYCWILLGGKPFQHHSTKLKKKAFSKNLLVFIHIA